MYHHGNAITINVSFKYQGTIVPYKKFVFFSRNYRFEYIKGHFLERVKTTKSSYIFKISSKFTYFYSEFVVYPFVSINETDKEHVLDNKDLTDILHFIEEHGLFPL